MNVEWLGDDPRFMSCWIVSTKWFGLVLNLEYVLLLIKASWHTMRSAFPVVLHDGFSISSDVVARCDTYFGVKECRKSRDAIKTKGMDSYKTRQSNCLQA